MLVIQTTQREVRQLTSMSVVKLSRGVAAIEANPVGVFVSSFGREYLYTVEAIIQAMEYLVSHAEIQQVTLDTYRRVVGKAI